VSDLRTPAPTSGSSRTIIVGDAPAADVFEPFGAVISAPEAIGGRRFYSDWLGGAGLSPVLHVNAVAPQALPVVLTSMERHPHAAQAFVPLDVSHYLVTVAPSLVDGRPDLDRMASFVMPGHLGVIYRRGVWHAGASVFDRTGHFVVLMWRGADDDDEMLEVDPIELRASLTDRSNG
jgi:ureidoglycolate lyase